MDALLDLVLIWSGEHRAYWKPDRSGYTTDKWRAGTYARTEADSIIGSVGPEKRLSLVPKPGEDEADEIAQGEEGDGERGRALAAVIRAYGDRRAAEAASPAAGALADIAAERQRQISVEGWTPAHDDHHRQGEIAFAAASYAQWAARVDETKRGGVPAFWPWSMDWWKPTTRRRDLVKAGALIIAEIERLDRLESAPREEARAG